MPITADSCEPITQLWSQRLSSCLRCLPGCTTSSVTWPWHHCACLSLDKSPWPMHVRNTSFLRAHQNASFRATKKAAVGLARTCCIISGTFYLLPLTRSTLTLKETFLQVLITLPFISSDEPSYTGVLSGTSLPALYRKHFPLFPFSLNPDTQTQAEEHQSRHIWWISTDSGQCFCFVCSFFSVGARKSSSPFKWTKGQNPNEKLKAFTIMGNYKTA